MSLPINFNNFSEKQKIVLLVCVAFIFLGIGVSLVSWRKAPSPPPPAEPVVLPTATPTPAPAWFRLEPASGNFKINKTFELVLILNSGASKVDAVDAILSYDSKILKAEKVIPGKIFAQYPIKQIDNQKGLAQISAAGEIKEGEITSFSGEDILGTITFRVLKTTPANGTEVNLDPNSIVASAGENRLNLTKTPSVKYLITD